MSFAEAFLPEFDQEMSGTEALSSWFRIGS